MTLSYIRLMARAENLFFIMRHALLGKDTSLTQCSIYYLQVMDVSPWRLGVGGDGLGCAVIDFAIEYHPGKTRQLVGHRHNRLVTAAPCDQSLNPKIQWISLMLAPINNRTRTINKERSQIAIASFADALHVQSITTALATRCQSEPGSHLARARKLRTVANAGNRR